jgi:hypothetical protein
VVVQALMLAALESVTERTDLCDLITLTADEGQAHESLGLAPPRRSSR